MRSLAFIMPHTIYTGSHHCGGHMTPEQALQMQEDMGNLFIILNILWLIAIIYHWRKWDKSDDFSDNFILSGGLICFITHCIMIIIWGIVLIAQLVILMRG